MRWSALAIVLGTGGCRVADGEYALRTPAPLSDCTAPDFGELQWEAPVSGDGRAVELMAFEDKCSVEGLAVGCDFSAGRDPAVDLGGLGFDVVVADVLSAEGQWNQDGTAEGTLTHATSCIGGDCAALPNDIPEPCTTTWTWSAAPSRDTDARSCAASAPPGEWNSVGAAPWDPVVFSASAAPSEPVVLGGGARWLTAPVALPGGMSATLARSSLELPPGTYAVSAGVEASPDARITDRGPCLEVSAPWWRSLGRAWTVEPFGRDPSFSPVALASARFLVTSAVTTVSGGGPNYAWADVLTTHLEILEAEGGRATFRILYESPMVPACVVLQDEGALSATGELTWSRERIEAGEGGSTIAFIEPSLRVGFSGDARRGAGGEFALQADLRREPSACADLAAVGITCAPCPDDADPNCAAAAGFG